MTRLADQLTALDTAVEAASERWRTANAAANRAWETGREVLAPLADYHRAVDARTQEFDPAVARQLTRDLFDRIERDGLLLVPLNNTSPASGVRVDDPRPAAELAAANGEVNRVRHERDTFLSQYGDDLEAERNREQMDRLRGALAGDDPSALREALR